MIMQCSFEETITLPDGSYRHSKCINKTEIWAVNDPCFGLCFAWAYNKLQAKNKRLEYDLAIVYEHTNLADTNTKQTFIEHNRMIRDRTKKYENLRLTAGPLYREGDEQALKGEMRW